MIPACDQWGPFAPGLEAAEFRARLRALRAIAHLCLGPRGEHLTETLRLSEHDADRLPAALAAIDALASLDRRRVLATFARLHRPA